MRKILDGTHCDKIYTVTVETLFARERLPHAQYRPSVIAAEGRYWEPARGSATFSLPPVFPKKTAFLSARTLGTRNHDTHRLQDRWIRRISSMVSPEAEHKAGCLDRISRIYRMMYRDSTFSTIFSTSGYFTSTSSTQYSSVLPAYGWFMSILTLSFVESITIAGRFARPSSLSHMIIEPFLISYP